jgi:hypothetical protein
MTAIMRSISDRLHERLNEERKRGQVIGHNLEYGLGSESVLRTILKEILPIKYGIAKGKLINLKGVMSRHLDVIIYDHLTCPTFFVDEHQNQVLPVESAYAVIEVKSTTSASALQDAFENLSSVSDVAGDAPNCSTNELVDFIPPLLAIWSFQDTRKLETIAQNYVDLSLRYCRDYSFSRYSDKSPGSKDRTGDCYLVAKIVILGKGVIYHMLDGRIAIGRWGKSSFGMFFTSLLAQLNQIKLKEFHPLHYLTWTHSGPRELYERR